MNEEKYLFTISYLECSETGHYWSKETNTHTVKIIASTVTEAIEKMKKLLELNIIKIYVGIAKNCLVS